MNNGGSCDTGWKPRSAGYGRTDRGSVHDWAAEFARTLLTMQEPTVLELLLV